MRSVKWSRTRPASTAVAQRMRKLASVRPLRSMVWKTPRSSMRGSIQSSANEQKLSS